MTVRSFFVKTDGLGATGAGRRLRAVGRLALDLLYPPACVACGAPVARGDGACPSCFAKLHQITEPMCPILGLPFAADLGPGAISAQAETDPPPFERARAAVAYGDVARKIVTRMKFGDRPELARYCAGAMVTAGRTLLEDDPVLVPVPLHRTRQWRRRFNQSSELAKQISVLTGLEVAPLLVRRRRRTRQQVGLSASQRTRNVAGAFSVDAGEAGRLGGRRLVLVDDVVTTGATAAALTRALKRSGFARVDVLSFARVVTGEEMPV